MNLARNLCVAALIGVTQLLCPLSALAATAAATPPPPPPPPPPPAVGYLPPPQVVCAVDRQRLCGNVEPGYGRVEACLTYYLNSVSVECRGYLENKQAARRAAGKEFEPEPAAE